MRGAMQGSGGRSGVPRVMHVRGWLKAWAREQGRGAEVDAIEAWEQQQRQAVASQLSLTPGTAQQLLELPWTRTTEGAGAAGGLMGWPNVDGRADGVAKR